MSLDRAFKMRVYLDTLFSRSTSSNSNHWVGTTFKSFSVVASKSDNFKASIVLDPGPGVTEAIPLRLGYYQSFETIVGNACFENHAVQAGEWIDVMFYAEDRMDSNPSQVKFESSTVQVGHARGELDGYTRQISISYDKVQGTIRSLDLADPQNNISSLTINTLLRNDHFAIPEGFYGEVLGSELSVLENFSAGSMNLHAIEAGSTITEAGIGSSNKIGYIFNETDTVGEYDVRVLNTAVAGEKGYDRRGVVLNAGEIPILAHSSGALPVAGTCTVYLMIRLRPVVE